MTDSAIWAIFNLDLEEDLFAAVADRIGPLSGFGGRITTLDALDGRIAVPDEGRLDLVLAFKRRLDPGLGSVASGLGALDQLERTLETRQLKQALGSVLFVDCSEMPNAPLSDFSVIGQFHELATDTFPAAHVAGVYALDAERGQSDSWSDGAFIWWDTRSEAFVDHMRDYLIEALQLFNSSDRP